MVEWARSERTDALCNLVHFSTDTSKNHRCSFTDKNATSSGECTEPISFSSSTGNKEYLSLKKKLSNGKLALVDSRSNRKFTHYETKNKHKHKNRIEQTHLMVGGGGGHNSPLTVQRHRERCLSLFFHKEKITNAQLIVYFVREHESARFSHWE